VPLGGQLVDQVPEEAAPPRVDAPRRLVEEEDVRPRQEGGDEGELLPPERSPARRFPKRSIPKRARRSAPRRFVSATGTE